MELDLLLGIWHQVQILLFSTMYQDGLLDFIAVLIYQFVLYWQSLRALVRKSRRRQLDPKCRREVVTITLTCR